MERVGEGDNHDSLLLTDAGCCDVCGCATDGLVGGCVGDTADAAEPDEALNADSGDGDGALCAPLVVVFLSLALALCLCNRCRREAEALLTPLLLGSMNEIELDAKVHSWHS